MSRSRAPLAIGLAAAGGVGYYLYSAGGSPRAAEKQFESELTQHNPDELDMLQLYSHKTLGDAHHVAAKIKGEVPRRSTNLEHEGRKAGKELGARVDNAVCFFPFPFCVSSALAKQNISNRNI